MNNLSRPGHPRLFLAALLLMAGGWRCAREVIIDLPEEPPRIVAICHFTENEPFRIEVSLSQPLYVPGDAVVPEEADVSVSTNGQFLDKLFRTAGEDGRIYWESRDLAMAETPYSMIVRIAGYPVAEASSAIPLHAGLSPIGVSPADIRVVDLEDGRSGMRIPLVLELAELPESDRFFAFGLQHEMEVFEIVQGQPVPDYTYQAASFFLADGRTLSLLHNIPEPVILINDKFWSDGRRTLFLDALIPFDPETERPRKVLVEWRRLSEEFYRYHLSIARQGSNLPLSDPDALFNNVSGGLGSFSGYSVKVDTLILPN